METLDFRSDTLTRPSAQMRQAMAEAEVGDDVYGEDPTVRRLEERIAERLGMEAAVFVPSGTMANQIAVGLQAGAGQEVLAEEGSHCLQHEGGGIAALWGAQGRGLAGEKGFLRPEHVRAAVRPADLHSVRTRLLCLENTPGRSGSPWPMDLFESVVAEARANRLKVHLDGARLFNAELASGVPASRLARLTDTTSVCFSKGLGAPVGSALCGSAALIVEARWLRKRLGGGMRQAGILAAGALWALEHNVERLAEDHQHARFLAEGLSALPRIRLFPEADEVRTNLVFVDFGVPSAEAVRRLAQEKVLVGGCGWHPNLVRFVCHLHLTRPHIAQTLLRAKAAFA
jgi:threonine aldolase